MSPKTRSVVYNASEDKNIVIETREIPVIDTITPPEVRWAPIDWDNAYKISLDNAMQYAFRIKWPLPDISSEWAWEKGTYYYKHRIHAEDWQLTVQNLTVINQQQVGPRVPTGRFVWSPISEDTRTPTRPAGRLCIGPACTR
jgi:hypothetical protein